MLRETCIDCDGHPSSCEHRDLLAPHRTAPAGLVFALRWGWTGIYRAQPERALERFEKAMKLSPLDPFAFNTRMGMASALAYSGRPKEAVAIAKDVTRKHSEVTWARRLLASWAAMAGDMETARSAAGKLLAANPDFTVRRYLAVSHPSGSPASRSPCANRSRYSGMF